MTWLAAIAAAVAAFVLVTRVRSSSLSSTVREYLVEPVEEESAHPPTPKDLGFIPWVIGVSTMPGAMAPTRMPKRANSRAHVTVLAARAALADT